MVDDLRRSVTTTRRHNTQITPRLTERDLKQFQVVSLLDWLLPKLLSYLSLRISTKHQWPSMRQLWSISSVEVHDARRSLR